MGLLICSVCNKTKDAATKTPKWHSNTKCKPCYVSEYKAKKAIGRNLKKEKYDSILEKTEIIEKLAEEGFGTEEIAKKAGIPSATVYRIAKKNSIKIKDKRRAKDIENRLNGDYLPELKGVGNGKYELVCRHCKSVTHKIAADFKYGCLSCSGNMSSGAEREIREFVGNQFSKVKIPNTKKEIDIYLPKLKLGIEYCGLYWHSELFRPPNTHYEKMCLANKNGIRLITIFEDEWLDRKEQVKGFLMSVIGRCSRKIHARKCSILQITKQDANKFLNEHHIQGAPSRTTLISFGIFLDTDNGKELVGVITGGRHHRALGNDILVLNRLCFKVGYQVAGGASKLFNALIRWAKDNKYKKVISWSDNRWSQGNVYNKLGFELEAELPPDYSYVKQGKRFTKQFLKKNPKKDDMTKTEAELRRAEGYTRIWDCGKKRWSFFIK